MRFAGPEPPEHPEQPDKPLKTLTASQFRPLLTVQTRFGEVRGDRRVGTCPEQALERGLNPLRHPRDGKGQTVYLVPAVRIE